MSKDAEQGAPLYAGKDGAAPAPAEVPGMVRSVYLMLALIALIVVSLGMIIPLGLLATKDYDVTCAPETAHDDHDDHAHDIHFTITPAGRHVVKTENPCAGKKPIHADANAEDGYFNNIDCMIDGVTQVLEQAGANVTDGYVGELDAGGREPIKDHYWEAGLCPVNVHWHLGAEHLSVGEFDDNGSSPEDADGHRRLLAGEVRHGFKCHHYDTANSAFTTEYNWEHCEGMHVGETYEIHWPHSAAGACGTPYQYQTPFYDGVFCTAGIISLDPLNTYQKIGVQGQVFTIINDEDYYYPDLIRGMIVDGERGTDVATYTGSTTGTSRDNTICSRYTPITWQVDRKCHLISASSFDKLCADMKAQVDDMSGDLHAHGSRELVADHLAANNQGDMNP